MFAATRLNAMKNCAFKLPKLIFVLTVIFPIFAVGQSDEVKVPDEVKPFVEKGMIPIAIETGDLNGDGKKDFILVLDKPRDPKSEFDEAGETERPTILLIRAADNKLSAAAQNDGVVLCRTCGGVFGDPFAGIQISGTRFTISNYGGSNDRWAYDYTFAYSRRDNNWQLVRVEETSFQALDPQRTTRKHVYTPPKNFGLINFADFRPDNYLNKGKK